MAKTLIDELNELANPVPVLKDAELEQEIDFVQKKDFSANVNESNEDLQVDKSVSSLRRKNTVLLSDFDAKYKGKVVSRKALLSYEPEESEIAVNEKLTESFTSDDSTQNDVSSCADEHSEDEQDSDTGETESEENEETLELNKDISPGENESDIEADILNKKRWKENQQKELQKSRSVKSQIDIWDKLLESRIQLQKGLGSGNKLPLPDYYEKLVQNNEDTLQVAQKSLSKTLLKTLNKLLHLESMIVHQNAEFRSFIAKSESKHTENGCDEEITSEESGDEDSTNKLTSLKKKRSLTECNQHSTERRPKIMKYSEDVVKKWNEKTSLASGRNQSFLSMEQSAITQINNILSDKGRLINRTQMKRSAFQRVGDIEVVTQDFSERQYDKEIFDDDDFYHQLLREVIERKGSGITDSFALGRHYIELDRLRRKMKKKVDTKASKGRRIRYQVHSKLVNFMAPVVGEMMSDEAKDELFSSLFGKRSSGAKLCSDINIFSLKDT